MKTKYLLFYPKPKSILPKNTILMILFGLILTVLPLVNLEASYFIHCNMKVELISVGNPSKESRFTIQKIASSKGHNPKACESYIGKEKSGIITNLPLEIIKGDRILLEYKYTVSEEVGKSGKVERMHESKQWRYIKKIGFWDWFF